VNRFKGLLAGRESRTRWTIAVGVAVALLLLGLGAVVLSHLRSASTPVASVTRASTCDDAYRILALRPSEIASARSVCLVQSLKFSGEVIGDVAQAYPVTAANVAPASLCTVPKRWDRFPAAVLALAVAGKGYRLRITAPGSSEREAITLNSLSGVVELESVKDPSADWTQASGTLTVNAEGVGGTIDADLLRDVAGAKPLHVAGDWTCGAPVPSPTVDTNVPCSLFYVLNQLQASDVARMKSHACNAEDLTFTGDIAGHVDHAVTDSVKPRAVFGADNVCNVGDQSFIAAMKFSIGDESFLLDLAAHQYPNVGPGSYAASGEPDYSGATLYLGHADASNQGSFVADRNVFWLGTAGTFTIARDMKSGTIDLDLQGALNQGSTVHISGHWRCAF
jgi:hypothetical protein